MVPVQHPAQLYEILSVMPDFRILSPSLFLIPKIPHNPHNISNNFPGFLISDHKFDLYYPHRQFHIFYKMQLHLPCFIHHNVFRYLPEYKALIRLNYFSATTLPDPLSAVQDNNCTFPHKLPILLHILQNLKLYG